MFIPIYMFIYQMECLEYKVPHSNHVHNIHTVMF